MRPVNVTAAEWQVAVERANGDRVRLANLVNAGTVMRVRGERNAILVPAHPGINLGIRPKNKRKGKR